MRQTIFCGVLLGFLLTGCSDEVMDRPGGDGEGRLVFSGLKVETVVGDIQTKASLEVDAIPEAGDFTLTVVDAATSEVVKTLPAGAADCFLPEGSYKVRATYGDGAAMSDTPYFLGESDEVTVAAGANRTVQLTASLACAVLCPVIDPRLEAQYESYTLTVTENATGEDPKEEPLEMGKDFFVRGGEGRTYTLCLKGTNQLGDEVSHPWEYRDLVVRTRYTIHCNPDLPAFTLPAQPEGNVWSKFLYITPMTAEDISYKPTGLTDDEILRNVRYEVSSDGINWVEAVQEADKWIVKELTPSSKYKLRSNFFDVYSSNPIEVTTEAAAPVPNGDFEELRETVNISGMNQGGKWSGTNTIWSPLEQNTCSFLIKEPVEWTSVNAKTCATNAANLNSWFVIPSTYNTTLSWLSTVKYKTYGGQETPAIYKNLLSNSNSSAMVVRNVAWDMQGTSPSDQKKTAWTANDCYNTKEPTIANRSAGKLFLGSYSYADGTETYNEGIDFVSRPLTLKGFYKYVQDGNDNSETGMVTVSLLNGNTVIGTASKALTSVSDYTEFEVPIVYSDYSLKATQLRIMITSSNHASYNQSEENSSIKTTNYNGRYESASRGATLTIDNLTFSYEHDPNN